MREIKFRGKRVDNGEWVYGYYFKTPLTDEATGSKPEDGWYFLTGRERHCISKDNCVYEVIPETVGQYTGLKDVNGKEIYEGDILLFNNSYQNINNKWKCVVKFREGAFVSEYLNGIYNHFDSWNVPKVSWKVIGNIYENPDLLKAGE